jgi:hypothetical protein
MGKRFNHRLQRIYGNINDMNWFRALIPTWRFFDRPGFEARLMARIEGGEWQEVLPPPPRRGFLSLLHNPQGTLHLALYNLLEAAVAEPENPVTQELLRNAVLFYLKPAGSFECKVVSGD